MRLKTIKLSGFKSFVDPTTMHLPSNLIGVVGPNGCGKSNIIDAVRWVMGESSAKLLRGESMADVIFNGSSARKPVGTATVELIFDNADGAAGGEYARFAEISVRRQVGRDGQSGYFLNGSRCRRRDITDIFLGTGLGPRSYSIIEQGMISRIVESRPEELRVYLEEAAGISKYKERRRETENRIRHTRDNLSRLADLRQEVDNQLERLARQARQAEKYKVLKSQARERQGQLWALQWRDVDAQLGESATRLAEKTNQMESHIADLRRIEAQLTAGREQHAQSVEQANGIQSELYQTGAEIARLEQLINHRKDILERYRRQLSQTADNRQELASHVDLDSSHGEALKNALSSGEPRLKTLQTSEEQAATELEAAEQALADWQRRWQEFADSEGATARQIDIERTRIEALDKATDDRRLALDKLAQERDSLNTSELENALARIGQERQAAQDRQTEFATRLEKLAEEHATATRRWQELSAQANGLRDERRKVDGRLSSMRTLQEAAMNQGGGKLASWLSQIGVDGDQRLAHVLEVDAGFESTVESALGDFLEALLVDDPEQLLATDPPDDLSIVAVRAGPMVRGDRGLSRHVVGPGAMIDFLSEYQQAGGDDQRPGAIQISPDGWVAGSGWVRKPARSPVSGVIEREREIKTLVEDLKAISAKLAESEKELEKVSSQIGELEGDREALQSERALHGKRLAELEGQRESRLASLDALRRRGEAIDADLTRLHELLDTESDQLKAARERLQQAMDKMAEQQVVRSGLEEEKTGVTNRLGDARVVAREVRGELQALRVEMEGKRAALQSTEQALARTRNQMTTLSQRADELTTQISETEPEIVKAQADLKLRTDERLAVDKRLAVSRARADEIGNKVREDDQLRIDLDGRINDARQAVQDERVRREGLSVKFQTITEKFDEAKLEREAVMESLTDEINIAGVEADMERLESRIRRLEPVNLAAIEEFESERERKDYLDAQDADLNEALETLEAAIAKIDRQTRTRFKETFDRVNTGMQELFPRLFGGGHAYLQLTDDDLLTSGVAIMARPPGKRVSNIHLLSGGEKALTAVSLVFSIFRLNPAPFCMLDEVDAPLDDANVGRFSELVREMSEQVQFICVTHNKITMEIAQQLMGVTMREAGVSRLVSVDVAEAERMVS